MQIIKDILSYPLTWEAIGFVCAIVLLCGKHIRQFYCAWVQKNQTLILEEINSATKLETEAKQLLQQYKQQIKEQQERQKNLQKQTDQEILTIKNDMLHKTDQALLEQTEATNIHIRLIADQHQRKMATDLLKNLEEKTENTFKKTSSENMNASIDHLFECLDQHKEIFTQL